MAIKKIDLFNCDCPSFMMVMPTHSNAEENNFNNAWCDLETHSKEELTIDGEAAFGQWMDLYLFLTSQGLVTIMPSPANMEGLADHVYVANAGIMIGDTFVVANFMSEPRRPETPVIERFMKTLGCKVVVCPYIFEGEAEMKYIGKNKEGKDVFIGAYGVRSEKAAYDWMEENFNIKVIKIENNDENCYHLDCCLFPMTISNNLDKEKANILCCTEILKAKDVEEIKKYCTITHISHKLADYGITNCVRVGSYVLCASDLDDMDPQIDGDVYYTERDKVQILEDICSDFGMEAIFINLSEFAKAGAMLSCQVLDLSRYSYTLETV